MHLQMSKCASWTTVYLDLKRVRPMLTIFTAIIMRMHYELVSACLTYRYIHTYIHKYSNFLVVLISVGLTQARPNQYRFIQVHKFTVLG